MRVFNTPKPAIPTLSVFKPTKMGRQLQSDALFTIVQPRNQHRSRHDLGGETIRDDASIDVLLDAFILILQ
jgi:hypothetical protein